MRASFFYLVHQELARAAEAVYLSRSFFTHTAIAEQIVNELACGEGGRVHGAKCLATLAGVAGGSRGVIPVLVPVLCASGSPVPNVVRGRVCKILFCGSGVTAPVVGATASEEHLEHLECSH